MPCSSCNEWVTDEWITWRRFDYERQYLSSAQHDYWVGRRFWLVEDCLDLRWFFYCVRCRRRDPALRGWYINADGAVSTDSEDSDDDHRPLARTLVLTPAPKRFKRQ